MSRTTRVDHDTDGADEVVQPRYSRRLVAGLIAGGAAVIAGVIVWLVAFSSVFGVSTVTVRGTHVLTARQVRAAARITGGTPLIRLDTTAVRTRVQRLTDVASARVTTSFPSTVTITVTERTAIGYVRSGGRDVLVDRTGTRFRTVSRASSSLPRLVLPARSAATAHAVAAVAAALPAALRAQTSSIQALTPQSITVVLNGDRVVQWGTATRNAAKARVLPVLLRRKDDYIDVTDPDQPYTR